MGRSCSNGVLPCLCLILISMVAVSHAQQQQPQQRPTITVGGRQYYRDEYTNYYYSSYFYRRFYNYFANWYGKIREKILGHLAAVCPKQTVTTTPPPTTTPPTTTQQATTLRTTTITTDAPQQSMENQTTASCTCPTTLPTSVPTTADSTNSTVTTTMNIISVEVTEPPDNGTANATAPPLRIPLDFYPGRYVLTLHPTANAFDGFVQILITCRDATRKLYLHSSELSIIEDSVEFTMANGSSAGNILNVTYDQEMQYVIFELSDEPTVGLDYYITMNYTGIVQKHTLRGFFTETDEPRNLVAAGFSKPYYARSIFPCFDEPGIKAQFAITLVRNADSNYFTLSSGVMESTTSRPGNYDAETFSLTSKLSTYTIGLLVGKDVISDNGVAGAAVTIPIKRRSVHENTTLHIFGSSAVRRYVSFIESLLTTSFPFVNLDVFVSRQLYQDGMENAGLLLFRESDFFYDESVSPDSKAQSVVRLIAKKVAQQFFGARVSVAWWDDLGIFDGIATYLSYKAMGQGDNYGMMEQIVTDLVIPAFARDSFFVSPPIYTPLEDARDLRKNFSPLSYQKTAALLRMMEFIMGPQMFISKLKEFYALYGEKAASHADFLTTITADTVVTVEGSIISLREIMEPYVYQHSFPVIYANVPSTFDRIDLFHKVPRLYGNVDEGFPAPYNYQWTVPITYTHSRNVSFDHTSQNIIWFNSSEHISSPYRIQDASFGDLRTGWFLINVRQIGYYRVKYDNQNYINLKMTLASSNYTDIDPRNRAQIVSDFYYFAKESNCGSLELFSDLLFDGMVNERHYVPLKAIFEVIDSIDKLLNRHAYYPNFLSRLEPFVTGMFNDTTMNSYNSSLPHIEKLARELIIEQACRFGVEGCVEESKRLFSEWRANTTTNPIHPSIKEAVYCTAIREGSYDEWNFLYDRLAIDEDFTGPEALTIIRALACTGKPALISRFVEKIIGNTIKVRSVWQTMQEAFVSLTGNPFAKCDVFDILNQHFIDGVDILTTNRNMDDSGGMVRIFESIGRIATNKNDFVKLHKIRVHPRAAIHHRLITVAIAQARQNVVFLMCGEALYESFVVGNPSK